MSSFSFSLAFVVVLSWNEILCSKSRWIFQKNKPRCIFRLCGYSVNFSSYFGQFGVLENFGFVIYDLISFWCWHIEKFVSDIVLIDKGSQNWVWLFLCSWFLFYFLFIFLEFYFLNEKTKNTLKKGLMWLSHVNFCPKLMEFNKITSKYK